VENGLPWSTPGEHQEKRVPESTKDEDDAKDRPLQRFCFVCKNALLNIN
jgi:hypothetical protein